MKITNPVSTLQRREFLKLAGATTVYCLAPAAMAASPHRVSILLDPTDVFLSTAPVRWAAGRLHAALTAKSISCAIVASPAQAIGSSFCVAAGGSPELAKGFPPAVGARRPDSFRLAAGSIAQSRAILVSASEARGHVYGLLDLAERVEFNSDPLAALYAADAVDQQPANEIRCVSRYFCSEIEDKPWYYDKDFWRGYLDTLAASRFNRFCLAYGLEYDFPRDVTDDYLHLPYPYLVEVPGYSKVRVMQLRSPYGELLPQPVPLSVEERNRNFEALKFIAAETEARGLHFQLGIWTHAYEWTDSPNAYHHIDGLAPETHATYCRDALTIILKEVPQIQGLTMRVHGESGIPERSYPFWRTLFEAIAGCGRTVQIDMHAKGVNQTMIDIAMATGMPVTLGAKYSAEHQSLGYHQADIRVLEIPRPGQQESKLFSLSAGSRLFTRYGYGDFLKEGSRAKVLFRLWPGTQRHLLSADPELAAAYGRTAHFCGALGLDLMEPVTFKGREGSGIPGGRCAYADESLQPAQDWMKYEYYYRIWGRKLYDPEATPDAWRNRMANEFGSGAPQVETALANASRQLPLVTSAHLPSASNHAFWPEIYDNMPIVLGSERSPYSDTPDPKCFGTVSPLDPQLFSTIVEHASDLQAGRANPKYSPIEVAQWLEDFASASQNALSEARNAVSSNTSPSFRRIEEDVRIQNGLGAFFAAKLRSGVLYEMFQQTGDAQAGKLALEQYRKARNAWAAMAQRANRVYQLDITYGRVPMRRGTWSDRLAGIDIDLAAMAVKLANPSTTTIPVANAVHAAQAAIARPMRPSVPCAHTPPVSFHPGQALALSLSVQDAQANGGSVSVRLCYRHVDQAERWRSVSMEARNGVFSASIPADYTQSEFPLQYYFVLARGTDAAWFYPAFKSTLSNQPYYVIAKRSA